MPTYEYKCDACGFAFEKFHSITAAPVKKCPQCGKNKVQRLIGTGAGLIFKGSGFYITDYRDKGYQDKAKAESGAGATSSGDAKPAGSETKAGGESGSSSKSSEAASTPAKSESKPAAKAESKPKSDSKSKK